MLRVLIFSLPAVLLFVSPDSMAQTAKTIEVTPSVVEAEIGQEVQFTVVAKDAAGKKVNVTPSAWIAAPFDLASVDMSGTVTLYEPGEVKVGAMVNNKLYYAKIRVKPARIAGIEISSITAPVVAGGAVKLNAAARASNGSPREGVFFNWASDNTSVATVDAAGLVRAIKPGRATIRAMEKRDTNSEGASGAITIEVAPNPVRHLSVEPKSATARTGDVLRFRPLAMDGSDTAVNDPAVRWSVSGHGAMIESDGSFVAERPGTYVITATCGEITEVASIVVTPRNVERDIEVVGRIPFKQFQAAEQWIFGNYAYVSSVSDKLQVYDISDPANPKLTETITVDARHINDISTTADGRIGVLTRENASSRKNGIVFLDTSDLAHPKVISEFTETVTGGVHSAFIDGHYVYLTDDSTGSLRVIDFKDVKNPKQVARWETKNPLGKPVRTPFGESFGGRYLHDVQVLDGLAYLAYWRDGLVILDVGRGIKGGSPENPQLVSQLRFNYHELYGDGWLAGAHAVFRYKNYVFVGDEVFPDQFDIHDRKRIPVRGIAHVIDVSDIEHPRKVAEYAVPESGAHNIWALDDVLYMGYYNGGGRVLDITGELRGDLYNQGREMGRLWTGETEGFRSNLPFTWGAQPHNGLVFFNDMNTGIWIVRLGDPRFKGSTTAPGK